MSIRSSLLLIVLFVLSLCGKGQDYFQQQVNYVISVKLDDEKHELQAEETIEYTNNSPDELHYIWMHLWPNAYKNNSTALAEQMLENGNTRFYFSEEKDLGWIDGLNFKVNGQTVTWEYHPDHIDICKITLNEPLKSGQKITISTPFHIKIPKGIFSRLGHMGESYQITQWYPKPAVYDKNGWHEMPYLNQGEFYSEFGSFDVSITLPKNYVVGATGDLQNQHEIEWLDVLAEKTANRVFSDFPDNDSFPPSDKELKTLRYLQSNVHDFAWFADKRWSVLKGEVELPHSKRKVTTWAMFTNAEADLWMNSIEYLNDATYYYSLWNGDYPYKHVTAVDGALSAGGGMEYPNITVIGRAGSAFSLETVIMHEVGHNWFYGILGSDERTHAWMDEGINSFNESRYIETKYPDAWLFGKQKKSSKILDAFDLAQYGHKTLFETAYLYHARKNMDQPIEYPSEDYSMMNYGIIVYGKTSLVFDYLTAYLGEATFDKAMQTYFDRWKFKHPQPEDLQIVMEEISGKNLSWFFEDIIKTTKKLDYKIVSAKKSLCPESFTGDCTEVLIRNKGEIASPFSISAIKNDSVIASSWYEGFSGKQSVDVFFMDYDKLRIDARLHIPETNRKNNTLRAKGLFKKTEPLRIQFLGSLENPDKTQLFFTPIIGWNNYDKTMAGVVFYNSLVPQKKFEYVLAPMYAFGTNSPVGMGSIQYNFFPGSRTFQHISIAVNASRFHYLDNTAGTSDFTKIAPNINFEFKKKTARSKIKHSLQLRSIYLVEHFQPKTDNPDQESTSLYNEAKYMLLNNRTLNPLNLAINLQQHKDFLNATATFKNEVTYKKGKGMDIRVFAGKYIFNNTNNPRYNWRMDGQRGWYDYTYDHLFLGRSETSDDVLSHQFVDNHGAFKLPTGAAQSNDWLASLNLKSDIPIPIPIGVFADFGFSQNKKYTNSNGDAVNPDFVFAYDAGIHFPLVKNVFEIYVPLLYSDNIQSYIDANGITFYERIRFTLHLNKLNPFTLIKNIEI